MAVLSGPLYFEPASKVLYTLFRSARLLCQDGAAVGHLFLNDSLYGAVYLVQICEAAVARWLSCLVLCLESQPLRRCVPCLDLRGCGKMTQLSDPLYF